MTQPASTSPAAPPVNPQIEIMRAGRHVAANGQAHGFDAGVLQAIASGYNTDLSEAPVVIGHPVHDKPAYGWVAGLKVTGAGDDARLVAEAGQVEPAFADQVRAGRFKKISASFYTPDAPGNPTPGQYYLRHVGFLGAQPPAVKGLKAVELNEAESGVINFSWGDFSWGDRAVARLFRRIRDWLISDQGEETADRILPSWDIDLLADEAAVAEATTSETGRPASAFSDPSMPEQSKTESPVSTKTTSTKPDKTAEPADDDKKAEAAFAEQQAEIEAERKQLKADQAAFAEAQAATRRKENIELLDRLVDAGRVAPGHKAELAAFMDRLDDGEAAAFSDAEDAKKQTALAWFRGFLGTLPRTVDFKERSAPDGMALDASDPAAIADAAVAFQEEQKAKGKIVSVDQAVRHVAAAAVPEAA